ALQKYDVRVDGERFEQRWWSCTNWPVLDRDGALLWIIHRAEDVTEFALARQINSRRALMRAQEQMEADLLQRADDRNQELRGAQQQLEQRVAARNQELTLEMAERKRVEEALRASEAHLREVELRMVREQLERARGVFNRLFSLSQDVMCVAGAGGVFQRVNPAVATLGFEERDLVGKPMLSFMHPDDRPRIGQMLDELAQGRSTIQFEARFQCQTGSYRWLSWTTSPDDEGTLYAVARDVTDARMVTDQLRLAKATADSANRELESFCYTVAHDLRAPLRSIDGFSQALIEDYADKLDDEGKQYLARLRGGAQRMAHLIDDLLSLSRLSRAELVSDRVDLSRLAHGILSRLREQQPDRAVALKIEPNLHAQGDGNLLQNALENLIGNAWKFTRNRADARIEVGQTTVDGARAFFVRDNGAGFDMAYAHKLFGAFQRLHSVSEFEGTGIGLASVARIIHRHGGRIWTQAEVGKGATFYFTLPAEELS
ncbi:MAG TPA: ATP-binding protein, partial [Polyangiales bacterium]